MVLTHESCLGKLHKGEESRDSVTENYELPNSWGVTACPYSPTCIQLYVASTTCIWCNNITYRKVPRFCEQNIYCSLYVLNTCRRSKHVNFYKDRTIFVTQAKLSIQILRPLSRHTKNIRPLESAWASINGPGGECGVGAAVSVNKIHILPGGSVVTGWTAQVHDHRIYYLTHQGCFYCSRQSDSLCLDTCVLVSGGVLQPCCDRWKLKTY